MLWGHRTSWGVLAEASASAASIPDMHAHIRKAHSGLDQEVCGTDFAHIHLNCTRGGWLRPTNQLPSVR